jgi:hypothetical protein
MAENLNLNYLKNHRYKIILENGRLESPDLNDELLTALDEEWGDEEDRYYD